MPDFQYSARDANGQQIKGRRSALSAEDLAMQLQSESLIPLDINLVTKSTATSKKASPRFKFLTSKVPKEELQILCRQMYAVLRAGIPLGTAVSKLAETTRNQQLAMALDQMLVSLNQGRSLYISLMQFPDIFSDFFVNLIRVGESTGKLDQMFLHLSEYLELETDTRKKVKTAVRYPIMVMVSIFVALMVINVFVIPSFANLFKSFHGTLPLPTRILIGISDFIISYWQVVLAFIIGSILGIRYYLKTSAGDLAWAKTQLKIPIFGWLIHRIILSRFARLYALVLRAGLTAVEGLDLVGASTGNAYVAKQVKTISTLVGRGSTISSAIAQTQLFPALVVQMITLGEETGEIERLLDDVADFYEREITYDLIRLSDAIEPIMLVIMGVMVLILSLGVFLPMWKIASIAK